MGPESTVRLPVHASFQRSARLNRPAGFIDTPGAPSYTVYIKKNRHIEGLRCSGAAFQGISHLTRLPA